MLLWSKVKPHLDLCFLLLVLAIIILKNYSPGTWLIGWDNIMPEFNIALNLKRSLFAVWQEYQGLGLVGGMGHATDLIRQLILVPFALILPHSLIRYLWHFFLLCLGTLSVYSGLSSQLKFKKPIPLLAALFYLLNFGSIQYFWAPLESFSAFWGFFPLLIFTLWNYLGKPTKKSLLQLLIINFLAIPAFYVQTLFIVYLACLSIILFSHFLTSYRLPVTDYLKIFIRIFLINSFWLLPFFYFFATNLKNPTAGIGNFMSSEESFARNLGRGNFPDLLLLRGYYFDFPDTDGSFMAPWVSHLSNHFVLICGYLISSLVIIGLIYLISRPKKLNFVKLSLLLFFLLSCVALLSNTVPFLEINALIRQSSLLNQVFRAPFTKFIVPAIFTFTLLLAYGLQTLISLARQLKYSQKRFSFLLITFYVLLITVFSFPVFQGNYISSKMRQNVPNEYFQLFDYLQTQSPTARIANLPSGSFWGWTNYAYGIRGSGFIWYALPQPVLDRAFDAWNLKNEQYYWELSHALQKRDPSLLSQILQKYSIEYVLYDKNVYFPDEKIYSKLSLSTQEILPNVPNLSLVKNFGKISLYHHSLPTTPYLLHQPISTKSTDFYYSDQTFQDHQDYISDPPSSNLYPFQGLFSNRLQSEIPFDFSLSSDKISITSKDKQVSTDVPLNNSLNLSKTHTTPHFPSQQLVKIPPKNYYQLQNKNSSNLFAYNFPEAKLNQSYLVKVDYQHFSGLPLTIAVSSNNLQNKYLYTRLESSPTWQTSWFILPALQSGDFDQGITVLFNNFSANNHSTINNLQDVNLYPLPFDQLIQSSTPTPPQKSTRTPLSSTSNIFFYKIPITDYVLRFTDYLVLPQSYSNGWLTFYFDGFKPVFLKNHLQVDNWANGWQISPTFQRSNVPTIYILFWPQLLEFFGLALIPLVFIHTLRHRHK